MVYLDNDQLKTIKIYFEQISDEHDEITKEQFATVAISLGLVSSTDEVQTFLQDHKTKIDF